MKPVAMQKKELQNILYYIKRHVVTLQQFEREEKMLIERLQTIKLKKHAASFFNQLRRKIQVSPPKAITINTYLKINKSKPDIRPVQSSPTNFLRQRDLSLRNYIRRVTEEVTFINLSTQA